MLLAAQFALRPANGHPLSGPPHQPMVGTDAPGISSELHQGAALRAEVLSVGGAARASQWRGARTLPEGAQSDSSADHHRSTPAPCPERPFLTHRKKSLAQSRVKSRARPTRALPPASPTLSATCHTPSPPAPGVASCPTGSSSACAPEMPIPRSARVLYRLVAHPRERSRAGRQRRRSRAPILAVQRIKYHPAHPLRHRGQRSEGHAAQPRLGAFRTAHVNRIWIQRFGPCAFRIVLRDRNRRFTVVRSTHSSFLSSHKLPGMVGAGQPRPYR